MARDRMQQDMDSEDQLVRRLMRGHVIYVLVAVTGLGICFFLIAKGTWSFLPVFLPPTLVSGFFALPLRHKQPTGGSAVVEDHHSMPGQSATVSVSQQVATTNTNGLLQSPPRGRLEPVVDATESRNPVMGESAATQEQISMPGAWAEPTSPKRPIEVVDPPPAEAVPNASIANDMFDEVTNPVVRNLDQMLQQASAERREHIAAEMREIQVAAKQASPPAALTLTPYPRPAVSPVPVRAVPSTYLSLSQLPATRPSPTPTPTSLGDQAPIQPPSTVSVPAPTSDQKALSRQLRDQAVRGMRLPYGNMRSIQPVSSQSLEPAQQPVPAPETSDGSLAISHAERPAAGLARPPIPSRPNPPDAHPRKDAAPAPIEEEQGDERPPEEVVIRLH